MLKRKSAFSMFIPLMLLLGGCGSRMDLQAASNLAKLGNQANTAFEKIASDLYYSCLRQARYIPLKSSNQAGINKQREDAEKQCENEPKQASIALNDANLAVVEYLEALGNLAANDLTNYNSELDSLGDSLKQLQLNADEIDAGTAISKFLFRIATERYRRNQLKNTVVNTDSYLTTYIGGLSGAINSGYTNGTLSTEKLSVDNYYRTYIGNIINSNSASTVEGIDTALRNTAVTNLDSQWQVAKETILQKQQLAQGYVGILKQIATDHNKIKSMYVEGKTPSTSQINTMVKSYVKELEPLVEKSNKLFKENNEKMDR